ncbi:MAG: hypothetical protein ABIM99_04485 [Candidatus Dojkabacteria bacterium]
MMDLIRSLRKYFVIVLIISLAAVAIVATCVSVILYNQLIQVSNELNTQATRPADNINTSTKIMTKIYFSKSPDSYTGDFSYTVGVDREIDKIKPVETALEQILSGPSVDEASMGLKDPIILSGESNCNGGDFKIVSNLTQLGTDIEIHFCKDVLIGGTGDVARVVAVVKKTIQGLETSANYKSGRIAVLDKTGNCLGDEIGMNACLK